MRIIIIGAGKLGYMVAETLSRDKCNVIVIDQDEKIIAKVNEKLDVLAFCHNGLAAHSLKKLGINSKDLIIAVTGSDEANMLACMSAKSFGAGMTIARIRNPEYFRDLAVSKEKLYIDHIVNPDMSSAKEIRRLLTFSTSKYMDDLAAGKVRMVRIAVDKSNPYVGVKIKNIDKNRNFLVAAISRNGQLIIPNGEDEINLGDNIYVIGSKPHIADFYKSIGKEWVKVKNVMILGGGRIGYYLAENLCKHGVSVKIIERKSERCMELAEGLPQTLVINGDGSDMDLLNSENVSSMDAFVAVTGIDEENVIVSLLAKQLGVPIVISKISRPNYISLAETIGIDAAITPNTITASEIMKLIRGKNVISLFLLLGGQAEVMEFIVHSDCSAINLPIKKLGFPKEAIIATIVRGDDIIIPHGSDEIKEGDRIIVLSNTKVITEIKKIFSIREGKGVNGFWNNLKNFGTHNTR